jgi:TolA-binding protein
MKHDEESTDLLAEARRRVLSRDEEARLEELVERSPEARIMHYAGWAFDRDSSAREGDDVLIAALASRAVERASKPVTIPVRRRKRPVVALLAAALAIASTAGAGVGVVYFVQTSERATEIAPRAVAPQSPTKPLRRDTPQPSPAERTTASAASEGPAVFPPSEAISDPVPGPESPALRSAPSARVARTASPTPAPAQSTPAVPHGDALSARSLFAQANEQRLSGDPRGAIVLYQMLTERHPASPEAELAELSLGKLLLQAGDASGALTHFRRARSSGSLRSEALWGEADALKALGRTHEERQTLERLLALHPDGAYANAARKRLGPVAP